MKLDSDSPYKHMYSSHENDTKIIVHNDNPFILAKDDHFMINMFKIDKEALKEGKNDLAPPFERKSFELTDSVKQFSDMEDPINRNISDDELMRALHCGSATGFQMDLKEDFFTDKIVSEVEFPEMKACNEDDLCHTVKDITIDKGVQSSEKSLVEKEEVGPIVSSTSSHALDNGHYYLATEIAEPAGVDELEYSISDKRVQSPERSLIEKEEMGPMELSVSNQSLDHGLNELISGMPGGSTYVDDLKDTISDSQGGFVQILEDPASVLHTGFNGKEITVDSFDSGHRLDVGTSVISNTSAKVTENLGGQDSDFHIGSDGMDSSVSSADSFMSTMDIEQNLDTAEPVVSNMSTEVNESPAVPDSDVHDDCDEKGFSETSTDYQGQEDTAEPVVSIPLTETADTQLVSYQEITVGSSPMDSMDYQGKEDTAESIVSIPSTETADTQLLSYQEITTGSSPMDSSSQIVNNHQKQSFDVEKEQISEESYSAPFALSFPFKVSGSSNGTEKLPANHNGTSGVITYKFDTETVSTSNSDENKDSTLNELVHSAPQSEDPTSDGATTSARCSFRHLMQGEGNACGPDLLSGPTANSGHIPYSGSISFRSESSTTSTRSFAFPILQSEWNSSPVKMKKADRRQLRKHRGWRIGVLCCRF